MRLWLRVSQICVGNPNKKSRMKKFKLIRSKPADAVYNMSLDRRIFEDYLRDRVPVLRIYSWQRPSFTYGISQLPQGHINLSACAADGIDLAKRMTGGGILFHDNEITYSFVCGKEDIGEPQNVFVSYRKICAFLIHFYGSLGLKAQFALETEDFVCRQEPSEFCSASHEKYDITINQKKIGGNAQKRARQAIFQHGSVPISMDWSIARRYLKSFPDMTLDVATSLSEELNPVPERDILEGKLIRAFADIFGVVFSEENNYSHEAVMVK